MSLISKSISLLHEFQRNITETINNNFKKKFYCSNKSHLSDKDFFLKRSQKPTLWVSEAECQEFAEIKNKPFEVKDIGDSYKMEIHGCGLKNTNDNKNFNDVLILTLGGYGRGELAPKSDIDLLFIVKDKKLSKTFDYYI